MTETLSIPFVKKPKLNPYADATGILLQQPPQPFYVPLQRPWTFADGDAMKTQMKKFLEKLSFATFRVIESWVARIPWVVLRFPCLPNGPLVTSLSDFWNRDHKWRLEHFIHAKRLGQLVEYLLARFDDQNEVPDTGGPMILAEGVLR